MERLRASFEAVLGLGGPVVALLLVVSVLTLALILYKLWQYRAAGVGRHRALAAAIAAWDAGDRAGAAGHLAQSSSYLAPVFADAMAQPATRRAEMSERAD